MVTVFLRLLSTSLMAVLIAGCASAPPAGSEPSGSQAARPQPPATTRQGAPNAATKSASTKANLAIEKLRLAELFRGTPVVFALQPDGSLRVDVPLHFSFDPGKATVKPPLAAVLDRIAAGQRDEVTRISIGAPADVSAKSAALVADRSASVRDYLVEHNLAQARVSVSASVSAAVVRIVVSDLSPQ